MPFSGGLLCYANVHVVILLLLDFELSILSLDDGARRKASMETLTEHVNLLGNHVNSIVFSARVSKHSLIPFLSSPCTCTVGNIVKF